MRIALVAVVVIYALLSLVHGHTAVSASACQVRAIPDPNERLMSAAMDEWTKIILVGVVTEELQVERDPAAPGQYRPVEDQPDPHRRGIYQSTVRIDAVLKGEVEETDIVLAPLSEQWLCSSGPLLPEGERVLLLLGQWPSSPTPENPEGLTWLTSPAGGQALLTGGWALIADYQADHGDTGLGRAEDVVLRVAHEVGAPEEATQAALAALQSPTPANDPGDRWWVPVAAGLLTVSVCGAVILRAQKRNMSDA